MGVRRGVVFHVDDAAPRFRPGCPQRLSVHRPRCRYDAKPAPIAIAGSRRPAVFEFEAAAGRDHTSTVVPLQVAVIAIEVASGATRRGAALLVRGRSGIRHACSVTNDSNTFSLGGGNESVYCFI